MILNVHIIFFMKILLANRIAPDGISRAILFAHIPQKGHKTLYKLMGLFCKVHLYFVMLFCS